MRYSNNTTGLTTFAFAVNKLRVRNSLISTIVSLQQSYSKKTDFWVLGEEKKTAQNDGIDRARQCASFVY